MVKKSYLTNFKRVKFSIQTLKRLSITTLLGGLAWCLVWLVAASTPPALPSMGGAARLYSNQTRDDLTALYVRALESASESILLRIYSLRDPQVVSALCRAADRGVDIQIYCDRSASRGLRKQLSPLISVVYHQGRGLMHQKVLVVDGVLCLVGSANLTTESLRHHANLVVGVQSEALASVLTERRSASLEIAHQRIDYIDLPRDASGLTRMVSLLDNAKHSIHAALFTWTHPAISNSLTSAYNRGVKVEAVIDTNAAYGAGRSVVENLYHAQVPVRLSERRGLLHHKMAIIDGDLLVVGSANWTRAAFTQNDDCYMVLHRLLPEQRQKLYHLWTAVSAESSAVTKL